MKKEDYYKSYIDCYNLVIDITKIIKDFFYPGEYNFSRIDSSLPLEEQMRLIKKDLESMKFEKEVASEFMKNLEYYYYDPNETTDDLERFIDGVDFYFKPQLKTMKEKIKTKYLPFIKLIAISDFKDTNMGKYSDDQAWKMVLADKEDVEDMESKIKDVIWALMDGSKEDIADNFLKDAYKLDSIEFNRYINGINNEYSSITKNHDDENKIGANFKLFDKYFEDIFGQDRSIECIRKTLLRSIMFYNAEDITEKGYSGSQGPLATFMFYGPTGTGKTETAKKMAKFVYGSDKKMIILDMNSYKEPKVAAAALKGHPEGYVDSDKGTDFTRFLTNNDKGIIVLDEFEKSCNEVRELFMTMLDEGSFKDALGNVYDLSGYIFVATTNVSALFENKTRKIGFQSADEKQIIKDEETRIRDELRNIFTAPIMNRFNNIIGFNEIKKEDAIKITKHLIFKLIKKYENKKFNGINPKIKIDNIDEIVDIILEESNFKKDGVRSLKNVINDLIGSQILEEIVDGKEKILVTTNEGKLIFYTKSNDPVDGSEQRIKRV